MTAKFKVVLSDFPWSFKLHSSKGYAKAPQGQYECRDTAGLLQLWRELGIDGMLESDCAHIMWATFPMLTDALWLMENLGFKYATGGAWGKLTATGKVAFGTGFVYRSAAEPWLVGKRGRLPLIGNRSVRNLLLSPSLLTDVRREHSRKPDAMHHIIESQFEGPYLELFGRAQGPGWTVIGNQTEKFS